MRASWLRVASMIVSSSCRSRCEYAKAAAKRFSSAQKRGFSSAITRLMRSAMIGSKSARCATTSSVFHLPRIGRASNCSRDMPGDGLTQEFGAFDVLVNQRLQCGHDFHSGVCDAS